MKKLIMKDTKQKLSWTANYEATFQNLPSTNRHGSPLNKRCHQQKAFSEKKILHHFEWLLLNLTTSSKNWGSLQEKKINENHKKSPLIKTSTKSDSFHLKEYSPLKGNTSTKRNDFY